MERKFGVISFMMLFFLAGCMASAKTTQTLAPIASQTENPTATLTVTLAPSPTEGEVPTPTITATPTPAATLQEARFSLLGTAALYHDSSTFTLYVNPNGGNYSAIGTYPGSEISYQCKFDSFLVNHLVCSGGAVPFGKTVYVQLLNADTNEVVYNNTLTFWGIVPTPTGMDCQVEPQWNGFIPAHQLDKECFALTCYQYGKFFYGSNNTCKEPWPFEWDFIHPLHTPQNPQ